MISIFLIVLAAAAKAVADTLKDHFYVSVFCKKNPAFWNPAISWEKAKMLPLTKYRVDGWHLTNSVMIVSFCLAACLHRSMIAWYYEVLIAGGLFNLCFNIFYNKLLRK